MAKIAIFTATKLEFNTVRRTLPNPCSVFYRGHTCLESKERLNDILLIQTGIGSERAHSSTQQVLEGESWDLVISTGFAGALGSSPIGSLLIGREVLWERPLTVSTENVPQLVSCHPQWLTQAKNIGSLIQQPIQVGRFVSVDRILTYSKEKHALHTRTKAVAVDMESGAIGQVAHKCGLPFLIVRAVSDGYDEDLPIDLNRFLRPSGWVSGVIRILLCPSSWYGFFRLYKQSGLASAQISKFFEKFLPSAPSVLASIRSVKCDPTTI